MKIETCKRGVNKDECYCGSEKDIKNMLSTLSLDDTYYCVLNIGEYISRDKNRERNRIFKFWYDSRLVKDVIDHNYRRHIWFDFFPVKKTDLTEELKEEFKCRVIPMLKQEILLCIKRNDIISFYSTIEVSIENNKLVIHQDNE